MNEVVETVIRESRRGFGHDQAKIACKVQYRPSDSKYDEKIRKFQGCPTVAVSRGGRVFLGWYSGGDIEPHIENYNYLVYSDDGGKTFCTPSVLLRGSCKTNVPGVHKNPQNILSNGL